MLNHGPFPYWNNPDHVCRKNEVLICAMQYACSREEIGFRHENSIIMHRDGCEPLSKFRLSVDEIV